MENKQSIISISIITMILLLINVVITIVKELYDPVHSFFKLSGHHWVGQGLLIILISILGMQFIKVKSKTSISALSRQFWVISISASLTLAVFFFFHK